MSEQSHTADPSPPIEAAAATETFGCRCWSRVLRTVVGLILYVFSIGPMFWYWYEAENLGGNPVLRVIYAPLRLICFIPQVEDWLNNYINWWIA